MLSCLFAYWPILPCESMLKITIFRFRRVAGSGVVVAVAKMATTTITGAEVAVIRIIATMDAVALDPSCFGVTCVRH